MGPPHLGGCRFAYERDGEVLGFAVVAPMSSAPAYSGSVEESVCVSRDHRGERIGTGLLNELVKRTEEKRYLSMFAVIFATSTAGIELHMRCGFRVIGTRDAPARDRFRN